MTMYVNILSDESRHFVSKKFANMINTKLHNLYHR